MKNQVNDWAENPRVQAAIDNLQAALDGEQAAGRLTVSYWALFVDSPEGVYETSAGCDNPQHKLDIAQAASTTAMNAITQDALADRHMH